MSPSQTKHRRTFTLMILGGGLLAISMSCSPVGVTDLRQTQSVARASGDADADADCEADLNLRDGALVAGSAFEERYSSIGRLRVSFGGNRGASCSGTLIRPDVVLTARHCVAFDDDQANPEDPNRIFFEFSGQTDRIMARSVHLKPGAYADIAIVALSEAYGESRGTMAYHSAANNPMSAGDPVEMVGYGTYVDSSDPDGDASSAIKRYGIMNFDRDMASVFIGNGMYHRFVTGPNNQNTCQGDSGGPALVEVNSELTVVGIASHILFAGGVVPNGAEAICRQADNANYTRVQDHYQWIQTTLDSIDVIPAVDDVAPVIAEAELELSPAPTALEISWEAATDTTTAADELMYKVVYSTPNADFDTVENIENEGTVAMDFSAGAASYTISNLNAEEEYQVAVLVRDAAGNISAYEAATATTEAAAESADPGSEPSEDPDMTAEGDSEELEADPDNDADGPALPREVTFARIGETTVRVEFDQADPDLSHRIEVRRRGSSDVVQEREVEAGRSGATISELEAGTAYELTVIALGNTGESKSLPISFKTDGGDDEGDDDDRKTDSKKKSRRDC